MRKVLYFSSLLAVMRAAEGGQWGASLSMRKRTVYNHVSESYILLKYDQT